MSVRKNDRRRGQEYLKCFGNKPQDILRGATTAGEASPLEIANEILDDLNNVSEDRGDILRCCVGRVNMSYAKTVSILWRKGERGKLTYRWGV